MQHACGQSMRASNARLLAPSGTLLLSPSPPSPPQNIYPREVEELLFSHPAVADAQVFGVPSKLWGEEVCAWVKLR